MIFKFKNIFLIVLFLSTVVTKGHEFGEGLATQFQFPVEKNSAEGLNMTSELISFLDQSYRSVILKSAQKLIWDFQWSNEYLGAGSNFYHQEFQVMLWGGFIRAPGSNFEIIAFTLCHELGHYLGGTPYQVFNHEVQWSSAEGQADWFAARECLPRVFRNFSSFSRYKTLQHANETTIYCQGETKQKELCQWILGAGQDFSEFSSFYFLENGVKTTVPRLHQQAMERPSRTIVSTYPTAQCRLDTIKQAGLCAGGSLSHCVRPSCWYVE